MYNTIAIIVEPTGTTGTFEARHDGRLLVCSTREPFCSSAGALLEQGVDPDAQLVMRHAGVGHDALRAKLGAAARSTVDEHHGTVFARWKPFSVSAVPSPTRFVEEEEAPGIAHEGGALCDEAAEVAP